MGKFKLTKKPSDKIQLNFNADICEQCPEIGPAKIVLNRKATLRIFSLLKNVNSEFGFKLVGYRRNSRTVRVTDIFVPDQTVSTAHFEFTQNGYGDIAQEMRKGTKFVGWGHSHHKFHAFHSGTDDNTDKRSVSMAKLPIASLTVVTDSMEWDGILYHRLSCGRVAKVKAKIILPRDADVVNDMKRLNSKNSINVRQQPFSSPNKAGSKIFSWQNRTRSINDAEQAAEQDARLAYERSQSSLSDEEGI